MPMFKIYFNVYISDCDTIIAKNRQQAEIYALDYLMETVRYKANISVDKIEETDEK